ncbi:hypothetical protein [Bacillus manliponensis]|uniref:tubby C-terminal domain-like protein n=1 Tax=Bacillus manliponensis TaxID=574376 RepID=UPI00351954E4
MVRYYYETNLLETRTKPLHIYRGTEKIGTIQGYYDRIWKRVIDSIGNSPPVFLQYELRDSSENVRVHTKYAGFWKNRYVVTYINNENQKHEVIVEDIKVYDGFGEKGVSVTYGHKQYVMKRDPFCPAELYLDETLIATWEIQLLAKRVVVHIIDYHFFEEEYLILGVFHCYFYATKG